MKVRRMAVGVAVLMVASLMQGCSVFYGEDRTRSDGTTEHEYGLLGGCLPLWHYRNDTADTGKRSSAKAEQVPAKDSAAAK